MPDLQLPPGASLVGSMPLPPGAMLIGASPQPPSIDMQTQPLSPVERAGVNLSDAAQMVGRFGSGVAEQAYDASTPNIATQMYRHYKGMPNTLSKIPQAAVMNFLAAGGLPESEVADAATVKAMPSEAAAAAQPVAAASPVPVAAAAKTFSGEGQLRELLSTQTNRGLLKIAKARGVDVSAEADLKSAIANPRLINKIIDNFSDGELDAVRTQAPIQAAQEATAAPASAAPTPAATKAPYSGADRPRVLPSVQNIRETNAQVQAAQAAPNRPTPDSLDDHAMQQEMNWDLERHGWTADAEARREFIAKNSTGVTKSELTGAQEAPVRYTKTPGVPSWRGKPASGAPLATPGEDLLPKLQQMLDAAKKAKAQQ